MVGSRRQSCSQYAAVEVGRESGPDGIGHVLNLPDPWHRGERRRGLWHFADVHRANPASCGRWSGAALQDLLSLISRSRRLAAGIDCVAAEFANLRSAMRAKRVSEPCNGVHLVTQSHCNLLQACRSGHRISEFAHLEERDPNGSGDQDDWTSDVRPPTLFEQADSPNRLDGARTQLAAGSGKRRARASSAYMQRSRSAEGAPFGWPFHINYCNEATTRKLPDNRKRS